MLLVDSVARDESMSFVACDYAGALQQAVDYLVQLGHRKLALVTPDGCDARMEKIEKAFADAVRRARIDGDCVLTSAALGEPAACLSWLAAGASSAPRRDSSLSDVEVSPAPSGGLFGSSVIAS